MEKSGIILAGGKGRRLGYIEKALIEFNGDMLISHVINALKDIVDEIIISVRDKKQEQILKKRLPHCKFVCDIYPSKGPITGMFCGLMASNKEYCFITACDMPFINKNLVEFLFRECKGFDIAIPRHENGFLEPLHAVYKTKPMLREIKKDIEKGETKILAPLFRLNVNYIDTKEIVKYDPELKTFMNINTIEDMNKFKR